MEIKKSQIASGLNEIKCKSGFATAEDQHGAMPNLPKQILLVLRIEITPFCVFVFLPLSRGTSGGGFEEGENQ
jgi:hypothetical protein